MVTCAYKGAVIGEIEWNCNRSHRRPR